MYIQYAPGIASSEAYPFEELYEHKDIYKCRYNSSTSVGQTVGYARVPPGNETLLRDAIASIGPIAFALNAALDSFLYYKYVENLSFKINL